MLLRSKCYIFHNIFKKSYISKASKGACVEFRVKYGNCIECYRAREGTNYPPDATISAREFVIRDFVVSSNIAVFGNVTADGTKVEVGGAWLLEETLI